MQTTSLSSLFHSMGGQCWQMLGQMYLQCKRQHGVRTSFFVPQETKTTNCSQLENYSWCFVRQGEAKGEKPEPHKTKNLCLAMISLESGNIIKKVYRDLSHPNLIEKLLRGRTHNPNESFHSEIWKKKFQKITSVGFTGSNFHSSQLF